MELFSRLGEKVKAAGSAMSPQSVVTISGLILHMALSMVFGVAFALLVARVSGPIVALGLTSAVALWLVNYYVLSFVSAGGARWR